MVSGVVLLLALRPVHELVDVARSVDLRDLSSGVRDLRRSAEVLAMAPESAGCSTGSAPTS